MLSIFEHEKRLPLVFCGGNFCLVKMLRYIMLGVFLHHIVFLHHVHIVVWFGCLVVGVGVWCF